MGEAKTKKRNNVVPLKQTPSLTRQDVANLWGVLVELQELRTDKVEFTYAMARTRAHLRGEIEAIQATGNNLEAQRQSLIGEYAQKQDGQPAVKDGHYQIDPERQQEFNEKAAPILASQVAFLKEPADVKVHCVKMENVPVADLNSRQLEGLFPMIQE